MTCEIQIHPTHQMFSRPSPPNTRPIFQSARCNHFISLQDARDVYEICKRIPNRKDRMHTYETFGMDGENVERYLHTVQHLNETWETSKQYDKFAKSKYIRIGPFHIYIHFDWNY